MMFDGAQPSLMDRKIVQTLQSFVVLPILATNLLIATPATTKLPTVVVSSTDENRPLISLSTDNQQDELTLKAQKIDAYFREKKSPLAGYGMKLASEAEKNELPWSLLAAIAMIESTGYKAPCYNDPDNGFGWGSCRIKFDSIDQAIETVAAHLGGNRPTTAAHYKDKDLDGILKSYNSVIPTYGQKIKRVMKDIETYPVK